MLRTCSFLFFGLGAAAAAATKSVLKQREVPATVSSFYVSVLYTAMLRTSVAAVVLGRFYFCPLDCDASVMVVDCAAVKTGCMLEKYIPAKGCNKVHVHFSFWSRCYCMYELHMGPERGRPTIDRGCELEAGSSGLYCLERAP